MAKIWKCRTKPLVLPGTSETRPLQLSATFMPTSIKHYQDGECIILRRGYANFDEIRFNILAGLDAVDDIIRQYMI